MNIMDRVLGWVLMAFGMVIVIMALGELILRVLAAILGLMLINRALQLLGSRSSLQSMFMSNFTPFGGFGRFR